MCLQRRGGPAGKKRDKNGRQIKLMERKGTDGEEEEKGLNYLVELMTFFRCSVDFNLVVLMSGATG